MKQTAKTFYLHVHPEATMYNCGIMMSVENTNDSYGPRCLILAGAAYLQWDNEYTFIQAPLPTQQKLQKLFVDNRENPDFYFDKSKYKYNGRIPNVVRANDDRITKIQTRNQLQQILYTRPLDMTIGQKTQLLKFYDALNNSFTPLQKAPSSL